MLGACRFLAACAFLLAGAGALALGVPAAGAPAPDEPPPALLDDVRLAHGDDDDGDDDPEDDDGDDSSSGDDAAGDVAAAGGRPTPPPAPPPAAPAPGEGGAARPDAPAITRLLVRPALLSPVAGRVVGGLRPTLRWRGAPGGTRLFNVQVYTPAGRKLHSTWPRGRALRVPAGLLSHGRRYVWRVWPYRVRGGYTERPLAVSWFATPPAPRDR